MIPSVTRKSTAPAAAEPATPPAGFAGGSRLTDGRLLMSRLRQAGGPGFLVAIFTAVVAALAGAIPAGYAAMSAAELRTALTDAGPTARQLLATSSAEPAIGIATDPTATGLSGAMDERYGLFTEQLAAVRQTFPEPLRSQVGPADWSILTAPVTFSEIDKGTDPSGATQIIQTRAVIDPGAHAELVEGTWPTDNGGGRAPVSIALSEDSAAHLGWAVGERHQPFVVSGVFRAQDPDADYWAVNPGMVHANVFDDSNSRPRITVTAFANPLDYARPGPGARPGTVKIWYPVDLTGLTGGESAQILSQLRGVTARTNTVPGASSSLGEISTLKLSAAAVPVLEGVQGRLAAARSILTVAVVGPLGAAVAVLLLGLRTLAARRRTTDSVVALRGASSRRLRRWRIADGLVFGLPGAVVGYLAVMAVFGRSAPPAAPAGAALVGALPAVVLGAGPIRRTLPRARPEIAPRRTVRRRWVLDAVVCGLAAVSAYLLLTVGVEGGSGGTDLLVAATPLLLAGAACVVVLRSYPVPLTLLTRRLRRRRSAVAYIGAVRALRDPAIGVAPVFGVVTGVALAVFSAGALSTMHTGVAAAAAEQLGAPLRLDGPLITDDALARVQRLPGVEAVARLELAGSAELRVDGKTAGGPQLYVADTADLAAVQAALGDTLTGGPTIPAAGLSGGADDVPALTSPGLVGPGSTAELDGRPLHVVGTAGVLPGAALTDAWVLVDRSAGLGGDSAHSLLLALSPDVGPDPGALDELERQVAAATGVGTFRTPADLVAAVSDNPVNDTVRTALLVAIAVAALAAAAAVVLTLMLNTAARSRLLAIVRVLGMSARDRRRLVIWEQAPGALVSVLVGAALGVVITVLVRSVTDLRPFTNGVGQPRLAFDLPTLAILLGGFVLLVMVAVAVGTVLSRRVTPAGAIRVDEE